MSDTKPPSSGALDGPTRQFQQWAHNVPQDVLNIDPGFISEWIGGIGSLVDTVNAQVARASSLRINEGAVGTFVSATATARALNNSGDAIRQRLAEFQQFASALMEFSQAAHKALLAQDGQ